MSRPTSPRALRFSAASLRLAAGEEVPEPRLRPVLTAPRGTPERDIQRACIHYLRTVLPPGSVVAAIENERGLAWGTPEQRARYGANRKRSGVQAGMPDAVALLPGGNTQWYEFKAPGGRLSPHQAEMHARFHALGHRVCVARSIDDVRAFLRGMGVPMREAP